ncbi:hypothetical protein [Bradyrhizobium sp.]|uniref:hypothetical protein n=1 Tax=Bradyrhizobium sp. TaxID=376 RepID=UPI002DDD109D|nr:hypothetical protein [Bradyrhizobium sp.]HEV2157339.1 hypothetical protein [Bradyrhizobium sp.]
MSHPHHHEPWRTDPGRQDHTISPYADHTGRVRDVSLTVARPAKLFAPMWLASTAARPTFVTIAMRPSSLGRVAAMDTLFPNFGKVEYFRRSGSTNGWGVLPVGQRKAL